MKDAVTVVNPTTTTDDYGNVVPSWAAGLDYKGLLLETDSTEVTSGRDTIVSTWTLLLPTKATIDEHSRVTASGRTYEVIGTPVLASKGTPGSRCIRAHLVTSVG